jgi:hypothetical protein
VSSNSTLDWFYARLEAHDSAFTLGGIDANKPGYHEKRNDLIAAGRTRDYSISQVAADKRGRGTVSAGIDLTLPSGRNSKMTLYTGRLRRAALDHDERLWLYGGPVLREYIGTTDGVTVECYVFTGGAPLGVGSDRGFDSGRSESHLWHIHLSIIRQYAEDEGALDAVFSVLVGESLDAWRARTGRTNGMSLTTDQANQLGFTDGRVEAMANMTDTVRDTHPSGAGRPVKIVTAVRQIAEAVAAIATALPDVDNAVAEQLRGEFAALTAEINEVADEVIGALPAKSTETAIDALIAAGGETWVRELGDAIFARLGDEQPTTGQ